jgi:hypothetical protein
MADRKKKKCGCEISRTHTILCDFHANEQMEEAAARLEENDYFYKAIMKELAKQHEKEQE